MPLLLGASFSAGNDRADEGAIGRIGGWGGAHDLPRLEAVGYDDVIGVAPHDGDVADTQALFAIDDERLSAAESETTAPAGSPGSA